MFAALDDVQLLRQVGIRTILGREYFAVVVPAKAKRVPQTARENLRRRRAIRREAPDARGQFHLTAFEIKRVFARFVTVRARATRRIKKSVGALRDLVHAVVEPTNA